MDLTKVSARIRPRLPYEAMDLGFLMVRHWWKELFLIQILLFGVLGLTFYLMFRDLSMVMLLLWWFKPVIETFHLQFFGRALFDERLHAQHILRHKWSILFHEIIAKLTWRRFHPLRSFVMPVAELEQLSGKTRMQRIRVLSRTNAGSALWLTSLGAMVETIIMVDALLVAFALLPKEVTDRIDWNQMLTDEILTTWAALAGILAMFLVMPFYVAAGFSLYINRRTWLEGWDIELTFKHLAHRLEKHKKPAGILMVAALAMGVSGHPQYAQAEEATHNPSVPPTTMTLDGEPTSSLQRVPPLSPRNLQEARNAMGEILEGPDFRRMEKREVLRPITEEPKKSTPRSLKKILAWFAKLGEWIAQATEVIMWASIALVILVLARLWPRFRQGLRPRRSQQDPRNGASLIYGPEGQLPALPEHLTAEAQRYWQEGNAREALSLLYRGALTSLCERFQLPLHNSCTEIESVEICQEHCPAVVGNYFNRLTQAWMRLAYGHREISQQEFDDLLKDWILFHAKTAEVEAG